MKLTTLQNGRYQIESILGQGGFGITYRAVQTSLGRTVAIKEFFMKDYCERAEDSTRVTMGTQSSREMVTRYREKFEKEARTLAKLEHPHIVRVIDVFQENNTSYYVMEYAEGASLKQQVDERGPLSEAKAVSYIHQVADALRYLHGQHICHLDIKPANILTKANGDAVLADFGLAKQYDEDGGETSTTPVGKSKGYAPPEQYRTGGVKSFSPETDIYALGATLYFLLTGKTPPESVLLNEESLDVFPLSPNMAQAVQAAMQLRRADRATLDAFEKLLNKKPEQPESIKDEDITIVHVEPIPVKSQTKEKKGNVWSKYPNLVKIAIILAAIANICGLLFLMLSIITVTFQQFLIIETLPLWISSISCILLYRGEKSGLWGILFALSLSILYSFMFNPSNPHADATSAIVTLSILFPTSILLSIAFMCKQKNIKSISLLRQTNKIKKTVIASITIIIMTSFIVPYYYVNKLEIRDIHECLEAALHIKHANKNSIDAYNVYMDYLDFKETDYTWNDYFYKDEEKAAYWQNKYNELKAQGK